MSTKNVDQKGRWRNKIVAVRMSPAEADNLDLKVALSGLNKQDYVIKALIDGTFTVQATIRMRANIQREMGVIASELRRLRAGSVVDDELAEKLEIIAEFAGSFATKESEVMANDALIHSIKENGSPTFNGQAAAHKNQPKEVD